MLNIYKCYKYALKFHSRSIEEMFTFLSSNSILTLKIMTSFKTTSSFLYRIWNVLLQTRASWTEAGKANVMPKADEKHNWRVKDEQHKKWNTILNAVIWYHYTVIIIIYRSVKNISENLLISDKKKRVSTP